MDRYVTPVKENARAHIAALEYAGYKLDPTVRPKNTPAPLHKWDYRVKKYICAGRLFWCISYRGNELSPPIPRQREKR